MSPSSDGKDRARSRFHAETPDVLTPQQKELYDAIVGSPARKGASGVAVTDSLGRLVGPFGIMTITPGVGAAVNQLGIALRTQSCLDPRSRELAILVVAANYHSTFEWQAHEPAARVAGVSSEQLTELKLNRSLSGLNEAESASVLVARALVERGNLSDSDYDVAVDVLGAAAVAELVWLCGYYSMLAVALRVFDSVPNIPKD
ncbi:carboxymuconolactone decarboxylase family protein [Paenarthrobacter nicotinovorans]|uniref:carboxymuconolactone decarboxylase family protein n=1 Tax=Paenarthrobacter nicotinovorans TaxID=29320 RepID=UPI0037FAEA0F